MKRWAKPQLERTQVRLFCPTLDEMIAADHPVRLVEEILLTFDFAPWEAEYDLLVGQPPIHPRVIAGVVLYGLSQGLRSSRRLEWACLNALDFMWLAQGRDIDHSTICGFRTRFAQQLKGLFKDLCRLAMRMGVVRLGHVALDGGKVKANSSRHATASAQVIEQRLAELDQQIEQMLAEAQQADAKDNDLFGHSVSASHLPRELADLQRRQTLLNEALAAAVKQQNSKSKPKAAKPKAAKPSSNPQTPLAMATQAAAVQPPASQQDPAAPSDEALLESSTPPPKQPPSQSKRVPVADPQSSVLPNKEGGYAPNYTPMVAVDGHSGFIVDAEVLSGQDEGAQTLATVDRIEAELGKKIEQLLADTSFGSGPNLAGLEQRRVDALIDQARVDAADNPALRPDPTQAVPAQQWPNLPINPSSNKLDRSAFIYDAARDAYHCPMGHAMAFVRVQQKNDGREGGNYRLYQCDACAACPLLSQCTASKSSRRTVSRDEHESLREKMRARLASPQGKKQYARRMHIAETPFAYMKGVMGLRQFLHRGLEKVKTEWRWACCGMNLMKLVRIIAAWRVRFAAAASG